MILEKVAEITEAEWARAWAQWLVDFCFEPNWAGLMSGSLW